MSIRDTGVRYDVIAKDSASKPFDKIGRAAGKLDGSFGKLAKTAAYAGAAIAGGVAAAMAVSAEKAVKFEASMKKVQTQAGATAGDVAVLSKQVLALGKTTQQGPEKLSEALYHLKSVGMDNVGAMKALKVSSDLAAVGGSDLEATTNALAGAWRTGIRGATDFGQAASTVNAIIGAGNMKMEDLVAALGTGILPTAKTFGLSFKQVGAALALFTDEGVDSASAATRLRMSISLLAAGSPAANKQLKMIHLTTDQLGEAMRKPDGLIGAIGLLKTNLEASGLSATKQAALLSRAFGGGKSSSAILSMINNLDVLKQKQEQVNKSMGKFPAAVAAQRKTVAAQLALLKSNLDVAAIQLGDKLLPPISHFVQYLTKTALPAVWRVSSALGDMIPVGKIKSGFGTVETLVSDFMRGFDTVSAKKTLTLPVPTLKVPVTRIPDALRKPLEVPSPTLKMPSTPIPAGVKAPAAVKSQAQKLGEQLRGFISGGISDAVGKIDWGKTGKQIGDGLGKAAKWVAAHGSDLTKKLATAIGGVDWANVGKAIGVFAVPFAIGFVDNVFEPLFTADFWEKHWLDTIIAAISVLPFDRVFSAIGTGLGKIPWGKLGDLLDHVPWGSVFRWTKWITDPIGGAVKATGTFAGRVATGFKDGFTRHLPGVAAWFGQELSLIPTRIGVLWLGIQKGFNDAIGKVPLLGSKLGKAALKFLGRYTFWQTGIHLVEGLLGGVGSAMSGIGTWINDNIVSPFVTWVKSLFGVHSPSTVFAGIGSDLISGLKGGVVAAAAKIGGWIYSHVISPVLGQFSGAGRWLYDRGSSMIGGLKDGITYVMSDVGRWVGDHVKSPLVSALSAPATWLYGKGKDVLTGFFDGLKEPWDDVQTWVSGVGTWIKDHKGPISLDRKLLVPAGRALMGGLLEGLKVGFKGVGSFVHRTGSTVAGTVKGIADGIFGGGGSPSGVNQTIGKRMLLGMGWGADQWPALQKLWNGESGWRTTALNASSGAYGIPQALPAGKMAAAGPDWRTNAATQIAWGLSYIKARYGSPAAAFAQWADRNPHWYASGGLAPFGQTAWVGEKGPELMQVTRAGTRIYSNPDSMALAKSAGMKVPGYAGGTVSVSHARDDVSRAQKTVNKLEREIASLRHAEATAHTKAQRKRDQLGIMAAEQELKAARAKLAAAKRELTAAGAQAKRVQGVANLLANNFLKTLQTGTAAGIASAVKGLNTRLQTAGYGSLVPGNLKTASRLETLANQRASVRSRIAAAQQYATDQSSNLGDFLAVSNTPSSSIAALIARMQNRQKQAAGFSAEVASLSKRGLNKNLLGQLADAGAGSQLAALLSKASASDITQLNKVAASQQKLTVSFGRTMADAMYDSGAQAGKGFLTGLIAQEAALQKEMNKLAKGMVNTIKKALGIKSPSSVARDQIGKQFVYGTALGVRMHAPKASAEVQRMADTMAAVRARNGGGSGSTAAGGGQVVHHHYETNYEISARTADYSVAELEVLQRKLEARQRVGRPR